MQKWFRTYVWLHDNNLKLSNIAATFCWITICLVIQFTEQRGVLQLGGQCDVSLVAQFPGVSLQGQYDVQLVAQLPGVSLLTTPY